MRRLQTWLIPGLSLAPEAISCREAGSFGVCLSPWGLWLFCFRHSLVQCFHSMKLTQSGFGSSAILRKNSRAGEAAGGVFASLASPMGTFNFAMNLLDL